MSDYIAMLDNIKITLDKDGVATLSGIDYRALRAIINAASLHLYDSKPKTESVVGDNLGSTHKSNVEKFKWHIDMHHLVDVVDANLKHAISPEYEQVHLEEKKRMREFRLASLEEDVRRAEANAAQAKIIHPLDESIETLSNTLSQASAALAKLKEIRREKA